MSTKTTLALALAAGFIGGIASQRLIPAPVWAQEQVPVPEEIRAHKFVLVDEAGVDRGVFGFTPHGGSMYPAVELMDVKGRTWTLREGGLWHAGLLPDATCQTCARKGK